MFVLIYPGLSVLCVAVLSYRVDIEYKLTMLFNLPTRNCLEVQILLSKKRLSSCVKVPDNMALSSLRPCVKHQLSTSERNLATQQSHSDAANRAAALSGCLFLILERTNRNFVANTSDNVPLNSRNDANEV